MLFLQNLSAGYGYLPDNISDKINHYILRSVDATVAFSKNKIALFSKLGPIAFFTTIKPSFMNDVKDIKVRMNGKIKIAQYLKNEDINKFIFITRPNAISDMYNISENQLSKIDARIKKDPERVIKSLTLGATEGDLLLKRRKNKN